MGLNQQSCQVKKKPPSALHPSPPFSTASMRSRRRTTHSPRASSPRFSASTPASSSSSVTAKPKAPLDQALSLDEFTAGILGDTNDMSQEDFDTNWVTRMTGCVEEAEVAQAAASPPPRRRQHQ